MLAVNRFWGIIKHGWMPTASFVTSAVMMATAASCWLVMGRTRKRWMLLFQVVLQLLYVVFVGLAVVGFLLPSQLDAEVGLGVRHSKLAAEYTQRVPENIPCFVNCTVHIRGTQRGTGKVQQYVAGWKAFLKADWLSLRLIGLPHSHETWRLPAADNSQSGRC